MLNVLIVGGGGREHALLEAVAKSPLVGKVFVAPGNAGMDELAVSIGLRPENINELVAFAHKHEIGLTIVGPEVPLTLGIVDAFQADGLKIFGPTKRAAILEASKIYTKEFCERFEIPTAPFAVFDDIREAKEFIKNRKVYPVVIKADGLAAGKGVVIAKNRAVADAALTDMMLYEKFGEAGRHVLIEDFMPGEEASFIVLTDGKTFVDFPASQDHKRVFDDDQGPNTGGMGAYAPAPVVTKAIRQIVIDKIIKPTLAGMAEEARPFTGFLYAGLMIDDQGHPRLVEFNCRLGDPETEVLLPLLKSDLVSHMLKALGGELAQEKFEVDSGSCVCVVMASGGYPGDFAKGYPITGLEQAAGSGVSVFHAGTVRDGQGQVATAGGRVLVVSACGDTLAEAIKTTYQGVEKISWTGCHYRRDIGKKGLKFL
jgi:phosphoribosylamine--glycine ligase